jgi:AcrR family transcriptional regulator
MDDQEAGPGKDRNTDAPERDPLLDAMLSLAGECGYRRTTTEMIAARSGTSVGYLYSRFSGREECFADAYDARAQPLLAGILKAARVAGSVDDGLRAGLAELFTFITAEPQIARALIGEVHVVGGAAQAAHEQNLRRLSRAVAGARRRTALDRRDLPATAATFVIGGLEEVVRRRLVERREELLWEELPDLVSFAAAPYLDGNG